MAQLIIRMKEILWCLQPPFDHWQSNAIGNPDCSMGMTPCWCGFPMPGLEWRRVFCTRHGPLNMTVSGGKKEHDDK